MADLNCVVTTAEIALAAATAKSVLQLKAAVNQRVRVKEWGVFFDGTSTTAEPVQVRVIRQTTAGTFGTTPTVVTRDGHSETPQTVAKANASAEPTPGAELDAIEVHPQSGYEKIFPLGDEIIIPGGGYLAIECTAPAGVNVRAKFAFEE